MLVRNGSIEDAQRLQLYFAKVVAENLPTLFERAEAPDVQWWTDFIEKLTSSNNSLILVAESEQEIAGILNFNGNTQAQCLHSGAFTVTVAAHWRSKGVGTH